jgi:hypothetical protein
MLQVRTVRFQAIQATEGQTDTFIAEALKVPPKWCGTAASANLTEARRQC